MAIWTAIAGRDHIEHWVVLLLGGLCGVGIGVLTFMAPGHHRDRLQFYIAFWAISVGVVGIIAGVRLRKEISGEWALILSGLPGRRVRRLHHRPADRGALSCPAIHPGQFAILYGILLSMLAFKVKGLAKEVAKA